MYKRDVGILILAICAVFVALQSDGPITFQKAWYADCLHVCPSRVLYLLI
jgi:hypothetical protein